MTDKATDAGPPEFATFYDFFSFYLAAHANPTCRKLHYIGTTLATGVFLTALLSGTWLLLLAAPLIGYGFAWTGHFLFEHNKPAMFGHPLWSLRGDYRMLRLALMGQLTSLLNDSIRRYGKSAH